MTLSDDGNGNGSGGSDASESGGGDGGQPSESKPWLEEPPLDSSPATHEEVPEGERRESGD